MLLLDMTRVYPVVIAAHPSEPNQFAIGLTDGGVHVIEPPESGGSWCVAPPLKSSVGPSVNSAAGSGWFRALSNEHAHINFIDPFLFQKGTANI